MGIGTEELFLYPSTDIQVFNSRLMLADFKFFSAISVNTPTFIWKLRVKHAFYLAWNIGQWRKCNCWVCLLSGHSESSSDYVTSGIGCWLNSNSLFKRRDRKCWRVTTGWTISLVAYHEWNMAISFSIWSSFLMYASFFKPVECFIAWGIYYQLCNHNFFLLGYKPTFLLICIRMHLNATQIWQLGYLDLRCNNDLCTNYSMKISKRNM